MHVRTMHARLPVCLPLPACAPIPPETQQNNSEAYHYETRYYTESYTDSNGNTQTRTVTREEKVVTWRGSSPLAGTRGDARAATEQ